MIMAALGGKGDRHLDAMTAILKNVFEQISHLNIKVEKTVLHGTVIFYDMTYMSPDASIS